MRIVLNKSYLFRVFALLVVTLLVSCSTENTGWTARQYHNTTARYNRYFHAKQILNETKATIKEGYKDDFNEILRIYPYGDPEAFSAYASSMDEILKKSAHVIKRHPNSKWIDNTYLLIGKSHFFRGDFYSAIDVFNFVYSKYYDPTIKSEAQLWVAKSYLMQQKYLEAEALLSKVEFKKEKDKRIRAQLHLVAAAVALEQGKRSVGIEHLEMAMPGLKRKKDDKYRHHYILGQLYELEGNEDSAILHFQKVKKYFPPYEFEFNSKLKSAKLLGGTGSRKAEGILKKMLKDDKNIEYYGQIYYELAQIALVNGDKTKAIKNFELSAAKGGSNVVQRSNAFLALGELYFEIPNYEKSQAYYDSASLFLDESHPKFEDLAGKNEVLGDLIEQLVMIKMQDSLLRMSEDEKFREKVIDELVMKEANGALDDDDDDLNNLFQNQPNNNVQVSGSFPFYNPVAKAKGYNEFVANWGRRADTDNWRISSIQKEQNQVNSKEKEKDSVNLEKELDGAIPDVPKDRKKFYIGIPFSAKAKVEANNQIEKALFEAGKIYKDGLEDYPEAIAKFNELIERYPKSKYLPATHYYLMICYQAIGDEEKQNTHKDTLITNYPEDNYAKIANGETVESEVKETSLGAEKFYNSMYDFYKAREFEMALAQKDSHDIKYLGDQLQIKFDYLRALILGSSGDMKGYEDALKNVSSAYPGTKIGDDADSKLEAIDRKRNPEKYAKKEETAKFKIDIKENGLFFLVRAKDLKDVNRFKVAFSDFNRREFSLEKLELTSFIYAANEYIIMVRNFSSESIAADYLKRAKDFDRFTEKVPNVADFVLINKENLNKVLEENSFDDYKGEFFKLLEE